MGEMVRAIDTKGYNTVLCEITDLRQEDVEAIVDATFSQVGTGKISFIDAVIYIEEILSQDNEENINIYEIMQMIGKRRGALISGGNIDDEKTSKIILDDFRTGKLGNITLEKVK